MTVPDVVQPARPDTCRPPKPTERGGELRRPDRPAELVTKGSVMALRPRKTAAAEPAATHYTAREGFAWQARVVPRGTRLRHDDPAVAANPGFFTVDTGADDQPQGWKVAWVGFATSDRVVPRGDRLPANDEIVHTHSQFFVDGDTPESAWPTVFDQLIAAAIGEGEK